MLLIDGVPQSHVDLDDPRYLEFEYVRRLGHVIDTAAPATQPLHVLHLGAGALTLARYVAATRPGSEQLAVEIDAALVDLVRLRLPLPRGREADQTQRRRLPQRVRPAQHSQPAQRNQPPQSESTAPTESTGPRESVAPTESVPAQRNRPAQRNQPAQRSPGTPGAHGDRAEVRRKGWPQPVRVRVGDARAILERLPAGSFDVVIVDVFAGGRTPAHLTSAEFAAAARRTLRGGPRAGILAANVADGVPLAHARAQVATARAVFPHTCLIADAAVLRGRRFGNLVLAASADPLPVDALTRLAAADPMPGRVLHGRELTGFAAGAKPVTDANARPSPAPPPGVFAS